MNQCDKKHNAILLSVIVPVYNSEKYLKGCIGSILSQSYPHLQVILIDDGSTDNSGKICDRYAEIDDRIEVIHKKNGGLSSARNAGLDIASGDYIAFVDSDDVIHQTFLETLLRLCQESDSDIAVCDCLRVGEDSIYLEPQKQVNIEILDRDEMMKRNAGIGDDGIRHTVVWNKLYRRSLLDGIRFPEGRIHEDFFFLYRVYWRAVRCVVTNAGLYYYMNRDGSITGSFNIRRLDALIALRERKEFLKREGLKDAYAQNVIEYYRALQRHYESVRDNIDNPDMVLEKIQEEKELVKQEILALPTRSRLEKLQIVWSDMDESEKRNYTVIYGNHFSQNQAYEFDFPYDRLAGYKSIAIYGAGRMGKAYVRHLQKDGKVDVRVWVDSQFFTYRREGYDVKPIDALFRYSYDCVLIAVIAPGVALEIKRNLIGWGISEDKIVVACEDEPNWIKEGLDATPEGRFFLMNTPEHGNLGDHALALAAVDFLREYFPAWEVIEITGKQWDLYKDKIVKLISVQDVLFFAGGGYMGDLWAVEDGRIKEMIEAFSDNCKIFLPQTFYYNNAENSILWYDSSFYGRYTNILFLHREYHSYQFFNEHILKNDKCSKLYPDMALYLKNTMCESERSGILFCFRLDKEGIENESAEAIYKLCNDRGIETEGIDTCLDMEVSLDNRKKQVASILDRIRGCRLLITDRLHGMLFAAVTGTPCIALDNVSKKVSGVYRWIDGLSYVTCVPKDEVTGELIDRFYALGGFSYNQDLFVTNWEDMAGDIRHWMEELGWQP